MGGASSISKRAEFCKARCPICTRARKGNRVARLFVKHIDRKVCPACRAYERVYQKRAYE
ncbi:hypothetical protein [Methermicoccus shengliensis]|uniref:Uncharacterized protein n=1 Tax=Methermicoccus shengliensis TaxID=660064 RepID=A0A832VXU0_9EURY|nr:hypothetical protein [Methermicoccus shengliensis]KUK04413.1 MAG: hypothetical protein XD46_0828 [Euryarchaeota archaeon 55_53]KUK30580.1 MAG: hypothetical protein XD62_0282 [Methanosarcinales archeaon 56_1174]MDI3488107.1 hypothetical protein [Methanosarcinales archaeon]MDN5295694.1 hypothetical protein [Methanosarcinales archaeon]HIH70172.1 hypothetical protein [Methermicoccus shengliensis]